MSWSLVSSPAPVPIAASSFVGRSRELGDLAALLSRHRLVTVLGPGGVGKTRLSLERARQVQARFEGGAVLVVLSSADDGREALRVLARTLGVLQSDEEDLRAAVATSVEDRHVLVVIDNCEHVVAAAAELAALVLSASVDAHALATSREPLRVEGEATFQLAPLAVPDSQEGDPSGSDAVRLFIDRALLQRRGELAGSVLDRRCDRQLADRRQLRCMHRSQLRLLHTLGLPASGRDRHCPRGCKQRP